MAFDKRLHFSGVSEALYHVASSWFIVTAINTAKLFVSLGAGQIFKRPDLVQKSACFTVLLRQPVRLEFPAESL